MLGGRIWSRTAMAALVTAATFVDAAPAHADAIRLHQSAVLSGSATDFTRKQGLSVGISADGRTVAVSASSTKQDSPGRVYVFVGDGVAWYLQATLRPIVAPVGNTGWAQSIAISADGNHIAVADRFASVGTIGANAGVVDTFARIGHSWTAGTRVVQPNPGAAGLFGASVALSGDGSRLLVGAPYTEDAWLFATAGPGWGPGARLAPPSGTHNYYFGLAVALSADGMTAVVGSESSGSYDFQHDGHAFSYVPDTSGQWRLEHMFSAITDAPGSVFGGSVAVSANGRTLVVGAFDALPPTTTVFDRRPTGWTRSATFTGQGTARLGRFGWAVAVSSDGNTIVSTAPERTSDFGTRPVTGGAYRFHRDRTGWHWGGPVWSTATRPWEYLGYSVGLSGDGSVAVLGAPFYGQTWQDNITHTGLAYIFTT